MWEVLKWRIGKIVFLQRNYLQSRLKDILLFYRITSFVTGVCYGPGKEALYLVVIVI